MKVNQELWKEFTKWGSGFTLEAERDYQTKGEPLVYHLSLYGLWWDDENEFVGTNLGKLFREAIKVGIRNKTIFDKSPKLKSK